MFPPGDGVPQARPRQTLKLARLRP